LKLPHDALLRALDVATSAFFVTPRKSRRIAPSGPIDILPEVAICLALLNALSNEHRVTS